jgi:hypothetical protein
LTKLQRGKIYSLIWIVTTINFDFDQRVHDLRVLRGGGGCTARAVRRVGLGRIVALFLLGLSPIVAWIIAWVVAFPRLYDMEVKTLPMM